MGQSWGGPSNASQEVVIKLSSSKEITDIAANPYAPEQQSNWVNESVNVKRVTRARSGDLKQPENRPLPKQRAAEGIKTVNLASL